MGAKQVFVVNDDPTTLGPTDTTMKSRGYETLTFDSLAMALAILDHSVPDLVILDNLQRSSNEIQLIRHIREISNVPIVVINEHRDAAARVEALTLGADAYLTKPFGGEELVARAEAILRRASDSDRRNPPMNYRCGDDHLLRDASRAALPGQPVRYIDQQWEGLVFSI